MSDVLVISAFRRPTFRTSISSLYCIDEPYDSAPLVIAASLEKVGFSVKYLPLQNLLSGYNENKDRPLLEELLKQHESKFVLFSSDHFIPSRSTATTYGIRIISDIIVSAWSVRPQIALCGRLATTVGGQIFELLPELDHIMVGEVDLRIGPILQDLIRNNRCDDPCWLSKGAYHQGGGAPEPAFIPDVTLLPVPAFHLLKEALAFLEMTHRAPTTSVPISMRTSYGCKFRCAFCAGVPYWKKYRMKTAEQFAREVDVFIDVMGGIGRLSFLEDEIFTFHSTHVDSISKVLLARKILLDGVYTHSSLLNSDIVKKLKSICDRVFMGLDNADNTVLKKMAKGQTFDSMLDTIQLVRQHGLKVHLEWIIGTPSEDSNALARNLNAIYNLLSSGVVNSVNTYIFCPHPGTAYGKDPARYGFSIEDGMQAMQESGGYPAFRTNHLTRNQIFSAYLMSQIIIYEATQHQAVYGTARKVGPYNHTEFQRIFDAISHDA